MENSGTLISVFTLALLIIRGYMGLTIRLILSKKERKSYQSHLPWLDRWLFWSAHQIVKDKYNKYEKRTIRYTTILKIYKVATCVLHIELIVVIIFAIISLVFECCERPFSYSCWLYIISCILCLMILFLAELHTNLRYHKNRYR